jgi:hypothetical protein
MEEEKMSQKLRAEIQALEAPFEAMLKILEKKYPKRSPNYNKFEKMFKAELKKRGCPEIK